MSLVDWLFDRSRTAASAVKIAAAGTVPPELRWLLAAPPPRPAGPPLTDPPEPRGSGGVISVFIPSRNEEDRLRASIRGIHAAAVEPALVEFCVADDASEEALSDPQLAPDLAAEGIRVRVSRSERRLGIAGARNRAASLATGTFLVATDAHVRFSPGWDALVRAEVREDSVYAGRIQEEGTAFRTFGCRFAYPHMGTTWVREAHLTQQPIPIAASPATALTRAAFEKIGGFDAGMIVYGAAEPEFSVRAWLLGLEVRSLPDWIVWHRFRPKPDTQAFLREMRPNIAHNAVRFGMLYLDGRPLWEVVRTYAQTAPEETAAALELIRESDLRARRAELHRRFVRNVAWFAHAFPASGEVALWQEVMGLKRPGA